MPKWAELSGALPASCISEVFWRPCPLVRLVVILRGEQGAALGGAVLDRLRVL